MRIYPPLIGIAICALPFNVLISQGTLADLPSPLFTTTVRTVVEDVVVMDKNGHAVPGLRKQDFQVFENGRPQAITFFEPGSIATEAATHLALRQPNVFTNIPLADSHNVTNVLLLDALDSWSEDQMYAQVQMVKFLASLPPHLRIGIFTLTPEKLSLVWPLNQDSSVLTLAIAKFESSSSSANSATSAQQQSLLSTLNDTAQEAQDSQLADSAHALQRFLRYGPGAVQQHNHGALGALQVLAYYLAGIPGRKNLFWIVGNFPHCEPINACSEAINMLGEAGVSVYPIDAHGVDPDMGLGADPNFHQAARRFIDSEAWAEDTGGKAYHGNDIKQEIADAIDHGSRYYTLAYVPDDRKEEGRECKVDVRVLSGNYRLFYRKRYFEQTRYEIVHASAERATSPLIPRMGHGLPNFSQIPYRLHVVPSSAQPKPGAPRAGQNAQLTGMITRYDVGFQLQSSGLQLTPDAGGTRHISLQVALVVYSREGKPLNWEIRNIRLQIKADQWAAEKSGDIHFHIQMDAPRGDVFLRTGMYDQSTSKVGTLEIPLSVFALVQK